MADEVLSQAEVESLLSALDASPAKPVTAGAMPQSSPRSREKISPYDFKRPERVGKDQMRALQSLYDGFSRNFGASLSALLRSIIEVKLTSVDQLTYSEFVFSLESPTCFNLVRAEPLEGHLILDINPSILFPIIDRLLGGGKDTTPPARRPLTEIELRLVARITSLFLAEMKHAWENVVQLNLSVDRVESNPQLVQIVPPNEVIILISFELALGDVRGMINLCIPFNAIERVGSKLTNNSWPSYGRTGVNAETVAAIAKRMDRSLVEMVVTLAETTITTEDLVGLRVGDIITTDKDVHAPLEVAVAGVTKFEASPGAYRGFKAVQVATPVSEKTGR
ncbi:MAG: flagellar motor switch protein FliM [Planctomycetes bacterium]|nr:flagellar motor switch protein FliM [Planctomycetota bacterium]